MTLPRAIARTVMDMFWHPSLSRFPKNSRCCDFPLRLEREIEAVQAVHLNDCVYVGGASSSSYQDEYRLFVYSLGSDNWNVLDTGVSRFALTSYKSKLVLIGGRKRNPPSGGCCSVPQWLRAEMAIRRRAQNARKISSKRVNYRYL